MSVLKNKHENSIAIIKASIKMMLVDGTVHKRELKKIQEIYFFLFNEELSDKNLQSLIFDVMKEHDFARGANVIAETIAKSIVGKRSRQDATEALILVMLADKTVHKDENSLIQLICDMWGTQDTYDRLLK